MSSYFPEVPRVEGPPPAPEDGTPAMGQGGSQGA
jgi:hypothetical protein